MQQHLQSREKCTHCQIIKWGASSRWLSFLYYPVRNSDQMTIENTHPTLHTALCYRVTYFCFEILIFVSLNRFSSYRIHFLTILNWTNFEIIKSIRINNLVWRWPDCNNSSYYRWLIISESLQYLLIQLDSTFSEKLFNRSRVTEYKLYDFQVWNWKFIEDHAQQSKGFIPGLLHMIV